MNNIEIGPGSEPDQCRLDVTSQGVSVRAEVTAEESLKFGIELVRFALSRGYAIDLKATDARPVSEIVEGVPFALDFTIDGLGQIRVLLPRAVALNLAVLLGGAANDD